MRQRDRRNPEGRGLRQVGRAGQVQRDFAEATVDARPCWIVSGQGFTRDAVAWANKAEIPLFVHHDPLRQPYAQSHGRTSDCLPIALRQRERV